MAKRKSPFQSSSLQRPVTRSISKAKSARGRSLHQPNPVFRRVTRSLKKQEESRFCGICLEERGNNEIFIVNGCGHFFCNDCVGKHVASKIQEGQATVKCPAADCNGAIELCSCESIVSKDIFAKWDKLVCESSIPESQKFYCPYNDCSALLMRDTGKEIITESKCPNCNRLFCAECCVAWHDGLECKDFQELNKDEREKEDLMLRSLVKQKEWNRCPRCRFYIEKTLGCMHIICRCGHQFCYRCSAPWTSNHRSNC